MMLMAHLASFYRMNKKWIPAAQKGNKQVNRVVRIELGWVTNFLKKSRGANIETSKDICHDREI